MSDWDRRELCPDGDCVGVIGADGTCSVCGKRAPNWSADRAAAAAAAGAAAAGDDVDGRGADDEREPPEPAPSVLDDGEPPDWDNRILCPDGACTGLLAPGGACSVCGRTAAEIIAESAT